MSESTVKYCSRCNNASSWGVFILSAIVYLLTIDHSASFWDCPEYVTCGSRLEVGHPPGNPVWMLAMRFATLPFPTHLHAVVINACSALAMASASFFLARIVYALCLFIGFRRREGSRSLPIVSACASFAAATSFAFCDSTWFSAAEAEVYAMSALITSLSIWLMMKWSVEKSSGKQKRWLILLAYIMGLSLGVHQLNLLCIPVFALIYIFRRCRRHATVKAWVAIFLSFIAVAMILIGMMQGVLSWAEWFELLFVNSIGLPYFSGVIAYAVLLCVAFPLAAVAISAGRKWATACAIFMTLWLSGMTVINGQLALGALLSGIAVVILMWWLKVSRTALLTANWMTAFLLLGYSSFALILIRGYAAPPMNEGNPTDIFALSSYIARDQYGSKPLLYGPTSFSKPMLREEWNDGDPMPRYTHYALKETGVSRLPLTSNPRLHQRSGMMTPADSISNAGVMESGKGYLIADHNFSRIMTPELNMLFPRITGTSPYDIESYADWTGMNKENMTRMRISEAFDSLGNPVARMMANGEREEKYSWRPTYIQNLRMFISYQVYYMYVRYLLWNFVGRQNDIHSTGEIEHGNFISGIPAIDNMMLGDQSLIPAYAGKDNPGRHVYYGVPFILGILGICSLFAAGGRGRRTMAGVTLMFLMTGLAIVVYLNQTPGEARERDYSFLGSYMAFCIWIGLGVRWLIGLMWEKLRRRRNFSRPAAYGGAAVITLLSPAILIASNYGDHQRAGRSEPLDFASDILLSDRPSIIFTHGDNNTFPLWYAQETEGLGLHHTVIDISYLVSPGYVVNLMKQGERGIRLTATPSDIAYNAYAFTRIAPDADTVSVPLLRVLKELYSQREGAPVIRHSNVLIPRGNCSDSMRINLRSLTAGSNMLPFRTLMILDIIATNNELAEPKALRFLYPVKGEIYRAVKDALREDFASRVYDPSTPDSVAVLCLEENLKRVLATLREKKPAPFYRDPVVLDHTRRRRGYMIIAARQLLDAGHVATAAETADMIYRHYPYDGIPAGSFTIADSTYHEGVEYGKLLTALHRATEKSAAGGLSPESFAGKADIHNRLIKDQADAWMLYYRSLSPRQRTTVSSSTLRIISSAQSN